MTVNDTEDFTEAIIIKGTDGTSLITLLTDSSGRILSVMKGDYGGVLKTIAVNDAGEIITILKGASGHSLGVDSDGYITATMKGIYDSTPTTVKLDVDGHIISVMKGDYGGVLKTIAVNDAGEIITILKGASGHSLGVDSDGYITATMKGIYDSTPTTVKLDVDGHIISVMKGDYGGSLQTIKLDSEHRMLARVLPTVDDILKDYVCDVATEMYLTLTETAVPAGKIWKITNMVAYNQTGHSEYIKAGITPLFSKMVVDIPKLSSLQWNGEIWLDEGDTLSAYFHGITIGDNCELLYNGIQMNKV